MSEVQHGNRFGTKNIDVFWNTGVTDAMALSVVARDEEGLSQNSMGAIE